MQASKILDENLRTGSTPKARSSFPVPEVDESTTQKGISEIDELRYLIHMWRLDLIEMKQKLARVSYDSPSAYMD